MQTNIYEITNLIKKFYSKDKKLILVSVAIGIIVTFGIGLKDRAYHDMVQKRISQEIIRFHILANSNTHTDQELKIKVKEGVLDRLAIKLEHVKNVHETREVLKNNLQYIKSITREIIEDNSYNVSVSISNVIFPEIVYQNMTLPAGEYESLKIVIGDGIGENWWCVMFPMLCFINSARGEVSEEMRNEMKSILKEDDYNFIFQDTVNIRFRAIEWWQNRQKYEESKIYVF